MRIREVEATQHQGSRTVYYVVYPVKACLGPGETSRCGKETKAYSNDTIAAKDFHNKTAPVSK